MQFHTIHFLYLLNNMKQTPSFFIFLSTFLMAQSFNVVDSFHKNGLPKEIHHYTETNNKITLSQKSYYFLMVKKKNMAHSLRVEKMDFGRNGGMMGLV